MSEIPDLHLKFMRGKHHVTQTYQVKTIGRDYRINFSQAYKVLYKEG